MTRFAVNALAPVTGTIFTQIANSASEALDMEDGAIESGYEGVTITNA